MPNLNSCLPLGAWCLSRQGSWESTAGNEPPTHQGASAISHLNAVGRGNVGGDAAVGGWASLQHPQSPVAYPYFNRGLSRSGPESASGSAPLSEPSTRLDFAQQLEDTRQKAKRLPSLAMRTGYLAECDRLRDVGTRTRSASAQSLAALTTLRLDVAMAHMVAVVMKTGETKAQMLKAQLDDAPAVLRPMLLSRQQRAEQQVQQATHAFSVGRGRDACQLADDAVAAATSGLEILHPASDHDWLDRETIARRWSNMVGQFEDHVVQHPQAHEIRQAFDTKKQAFNATRDSASAWAMLNEMSDFVEQLKRAICPLPPSYEEAMRDWRAC